MARSVEQAIAVLREAQTAINDACAESWDDRQRFDDYDAMCTRLSVADLGGVLAVSYFGSSYTGWPEALEALGVPGVAEHIGSLHINGPDEGANGTRDLNFSSLIAAQPAFTQLKNLVIAQSDTGDHNQTVVDEAQIAPLLALMPALVRLTLPQPPEPEFFDLEFKHLRTIVLGRAYRTYGFIGHLADRSQGLPALGYLDFSDSLAPLLDVEVQEDPDWDSTPFTDYERLFDADISAQLWGMRVRNSRLTEAELLALRAKRPKLQLSVALDAPHAYVQHWNKTQFPHKHLILGK